MATFAIDAGNDLETIDIPEEMMDAYADVLHAPCVLKVDAEDRSFEMSAFGIALTGTIDITTISLMPPTTLDLGFSR